jgi:hypothetical protein
MTLQRMMYCTELHNIDTNSYIGTRSKEHLQENNEYGNNR